MFGPGDALHVKLAHCLGMGAVTPSTARHDSEPERRLRQHERAEQEGDNLQQVDDRSRPRREIGKRERQEQGRRRRPEEDAGHRRAARSRRAFAITDTELSDIASAATTGLSRKPNVGYSTPAATGTPIAL